MRLSGTSVTVVVPLLALAVGCTTTQQIRRPADLASFQRMAAAKGGRVDVLYAPELDELDPPVASAAQRTPGHGASPTFSARRGAGALAAVTETGLVVERSAGALELALPQVRGFEVRSRGKGAVEGLGIGLASGVILGVIAGLAAGDDPPESCYVCFEASDKAILGGAILGVSGGLTGLLIGSLTGHSDRFVF